MRSSWTRPPGWVLLPALLGAAVVLLPVIGMLSRLDWAAIPELLTSESSLAALRLSLWASAAATVLCLLLGVPLALLLAAAAANPNRFRAAGLLRSLVLLPLVLPPVVGGLALLYTFGSQGLLSGALEFFGIRIAYTSVAVVLAMTFVSMPFLVISVETALRGLDRHLLEAATVDGASRTQVLRYMVLPLLSPALISGAVLAFARSLGEFGATLAFAGSMQGVTRTLPLEIYLQRETDPDAAMALSLLLIMVAVLVISLAYSRSRSTWQQ
ncbi:molybdate ABC transporter permease subunit [Nesterenkonia sp. MY13]|uniref:Molybdenum transport system permease n=1 Tax=Nesterenkonia sedimenti TaxID=1463632 RepID=A0A7X8TIL0_9MICC|nr:ABC transporter permease [Nesterenkonia sedimenti]NLS09135.1 molybdate ABC transporter permease subunit [Nesterenkonia sedimenti]